MKANSLILLFMLGFFSFVYAQNVVGKYINEVQFKDKDIQPAQNKLLNLEGTELMLLRDDTIQIMYSKTIWLKDLILKRVE
ncbi:hypothetical protein [Lacinutrix chionoecetis]